MHSLEVKPCFERERESNLLESSFSTRGPRLRFSCCARRLILLAAQFQFQRERILEVSALAGSEIDAAIRTWNELSSRGEEGDGSDAGQATLRGAKLLQDACQPPYVTLFRRIAQQPEGIQLLVRMREDMLEEAGRAAAASAPVRAMSESLRTLLSDWFSTGIMRLERISWKTSPAALLEKVVAGEAVHSIRGWRDLRRRLGRRKRLFAFFHPSMPEEPLVLLHTALTDSVAARMADVLLPSEEEDEAPGVASGRPERGPSDRQRADGGPTVTTAVFYSISSTQPGLRGVELGNFLIKQAAQELQREIPTLQMLVTLSPIPGFRQWLEERMHRELQGEEEDEQGAGLARMRRQLLTDAEASRCLEVLPHTAPSGRRACCQAAAVASLSEALSSDEWRANPKALDALKPILMRLCAHYLLRERRRKSALDPVANFHLRNGAWLWRINWDADASNAGLSRSYGMMVNYRYILDDIEQNNRNYTEEGHIAASNNVMELLPNDN